MNKTTSALAVAQAVIYATDAAWLPDLNVVRPRTQFGYRKPGNSLGAPIGYCTNRDHVCGANGQIWNKTKSQPGKANSRVRMSKKERNA